MKNPLLSVLIIIAGLGITTVGAQPAEEGLVLTNREAFRYPPMLLLEGKTDLGTAKVRAEVGTDGRVMEFVCIEATKMEFAREAIRGFKMAQFSPMLDEEGEPVAVRADFNITFRYENGVSSISMHQHIDNLITGMIPAEPELQKASPRDLDTPLRRLDSNLPLVAVDDDGNLLQGQVLLGFHIDHEGRPQLPIVLESNNPIVAEAAIETVMKWEFTPPTVKGNPRVLEVRQRIQVGD